MTVYNPHPDGFMSPSTVSIYILDPIDTYKWKNTNYEIKGHM